MYSSIYTYNYLITIYENTVHLGGWLSINRKHLPIASIPVVGWAMDHTLQDFRCFEIRSEKLNKMVQTTEQKEFLIRKVGCQMFEPAATWMTCLVEADLCRVSD